MKWLRKTVGTRFVVIYSSIYVLLVLDLIAHARLKYGYLFGKEDISYSDIYRYMNGNLNINVDACATLFGLFFMVGAFLFGFWRTIRNQPFYHPRYTEWLRSMPWIPKQALPIVPASFGLQDCAVVAVLCGLSMLHQFTWASVIPLCMVMGGVIGTLPAELMLHHRFTLYARVMLVLALATGLRMGVGMDLLLILGALGFLLLNNYSIRKILGQFPWDLSESTLDKPFSLAFARMFPNSIRARNQISLYLPLPELRFGSNQDMEEERLGWPLARLQAKPESDSVDMGDALLQSFILGWFVALFPANKFDNPTAMFVLMGALVRFGYGAMSLYFARPSVS